MTSKNIYFATQDKTELAHELEEKMSAWSNHLVSGGIEKRWRKSYQLYFGKHFGTTQTFNNSEILRLGEDGELSVFSVNHYRNLIKHILSLTVNQKPAFDARAVNSDLKSLQQAKLANNILDAYLREKRLGRYLKMAAEHALVFGKGFIKCVWEPSLGRPHDVQYLDDGAPRVIYEGDVELSNLDPFSVYVDQTLEDWNQNEWVVFREFKNKFSLATRYPELSDEIRNLPTKSDLDTTASRWLTLQKLDESASVPVYSFYHKRTEAMPNGRYTLFCNGDTVLYDGPIPYAKLPIFRIVPGEIFGSTEGYTDFFDLIGPQEALDVLASTIFSNQQAFGVQNVLVPEGCNISADQIGKALAVLKYNPQAGEPKPLQLTQTPAEVFKFYELLERSLETLSGVNSVARGNPDSSLKSGVALGLVQSMAVQYASGFQQSWAELLEDTGTFILDLLKHFAKTERMVAMAGKHNKGAMAEFTGDDLVNIDRVVVELGNPMARTTAGRVQIADNLLEKGLIKTPQEYLTVMNTGNLDPLIEGPEAEISLIRKENETMMEGKPVQAIVGDSHVLHMQEHKALLSNPLVRQEGQIVELVLGHIQEHMQLYKTQDPLWSMVAGEPPAPAPQAPPMPPQGPQGSPASPQGGAPNPMAEMPQEMMPPQEGEPAGPMPQMPPMPGV